MVLYHAISSYQLLEAILHRNSYHKNSDAILVLPDFIVSKYPQYKNLEKLNLFTEVILFPYMEIKHNKATVLRDTEKFYYETVKIEPQKFENIYIGGCHFYFSLFLINKGVKFSVFEDSAGMIFNPKKIYYPLLKTFPIHAHIALENKLINYKNKNIESVYVNRINPKCKKMQIVFSVYEQIKANAELRNKIIVFFNVEYKKFTKDSILLLTEQFYNLGIMSEAQQKDLYSYICNEMYKNEKIVIKPHPDDHIDYLSLLKNVRVWDDIFPSELLPYVCEQPKEIVSVSSTAIKHLKGFAKKMTVFALDSAFNKILKSKKISTKIIKKGVDNL